MWHIVCEYKHEHLDITDRNINTKEKTSKKIQRKRNSLNVFIVTINPLKVSWTWKELVQMAESWSIIIKPNMYQIYPGNQIVPWRWKIK